MNETTAKLQPGTHVRFTANNLGAIDPEDGRPFFVERTFSEGEWGIVTDVESPELSDWLYVRPDDAPHLLVPVHPDMIEEADPRDV